MTISDMLRNPLYSPQCHGQSPQCVQQWYCHRPAFQKNRGKAKKTPFHHPVYQFLSFWAQCLILRQTHSKCWILMVKSC